MPSADDAHTKTDIAIPINRYAQIRSFCVAGEIMYIIEMRLFYGLRLVTTETI